MTIRPVVILPANGLTVAPAQAIDAVTGPKTFGRALAFLLETVGLVGGATVTFETAD